MDNDKQKSAENSASPRPGIFSTPDLTVDTEKLAQAVPSADSNKSRIASVFANTDATRQAQQSTITSTPLEGDIVLNGAPKKRSKTPIIVIIACLVIIMSVTVTTIALMGAHDKTSDISSKTAKTDFDHFATYLLYETEKDILRDEYEPTREYAVARNMGTSQENDRFWEEVLRLFGTARQSYDELFRADESSLNILDSYSKNLIFLDTYRKKDMSDINNIISEYVDYGYDFAFSKLEDFYADMNNINNATSLQYYNFIIKEYEAMFKLIDYYVEYGCMKNGAIDSTCVKNIVNIEDDKDSGLIRAVSDYNDSTQQTMLFVDGIISSVIENCWAIDNNIEIFLETSNAAA